METNRRKFIATALVGGLAATLPLSSCNQEDTSSDYSKLDEIIKQPVFKKGMFSTPDGLGYLYMMHFISAIPYAGPYHEFKGFGLDVPVESKTSSFLSENGIFKVPTGPGLGVDIDADFLKKHKVLI